MPSDDDDVTRRNDVAVTGVGPVRRQVAAGLRELGAVDQAIYSAVASTPTPSLDEPLRRLSNTANNSRLWLAIAAGLLRPLPPAAMPYLRRMGLDQPRGLSQRLLAGPTARKTRPCLCHLGLVQFLFPRAGPESDGRTVDPDCKSFWA